MNKPLAGNGNGNGGGANGLLQQVQKRPAPPADAPSSEAGEGGVAFQTHSGLELRGAPVRTTRHRAVFEVFGPAGALRLSEALPVFQIALQGRTVYSGRAVVRHLVDAGTKTVCEAALDEAHWTDLNLIPALPPEGQMAREFKAFLKGWEKFYAMSPEFKVAIVDMQTFLHGLRLWLDGVEVQIGSQPVEIRPQIERMLMNDLREPILTAFRNLLEKFESLAQQVPSDLRPAYIAYMQRQIHPFVLSAPFIHRTFFKPLGYAGDYEMVNMMVRPPHEGDSLLAKILNYIFLNTPPVEAHRNRLVYLTRMLRDETVRAGAQRRENRVRIFNLGCGPAIEIQDFLTHHRVSDLAHFLLLDFNHETLAYTSKILKQLALEHQRQTRIETAKKSVQQILKEAPKLEKSLGKFDIVYCAGLFDYLPDTVCEKLLEFFYDIAAPGGLIVTTNVANINPSRGWMEYMLDWYLIYRSVEQFRALVPKTIHPEQTVVRAIGTGVNIAVEIRKPHD
ncbi:MAG TPA: class I SAM-dependent methyltransferase [Candidatus Saccharimonadales bacterium]|nr:class I SAM-dependent methyltransferase [Candidatus Saccharimonadales bacterium]